MKLSRVLFTFIILTTSLSCSIPIDSNDVSYKVFYYTQDDKCKVDMLEGYQLPSLPDVSTIDDDYLIIDSLVDHIKELRNDLNKLTGPGCNR